MKAVAIIVNLFFPGVGTFFVGKIGQAIAQIILYIIGLVLAFTVIGAIIGIPLCIGVWIWGLVSVANSPAQPIQVVVMHKNEPPSQTADASQSKGVESSISSTFNTSVSITARFDRAKWNALLQYDKDIALIADKLQPLGQKWLDELASSYLALNDKQYLPEIEHKIIVAAGREAEEKEQEAIAAAKAEAEEKEQLRIRAEEQQKVYEEQQKVYLQEQERRSQARKEQIELWRDRLTGNRNVLIILDFGH